MTIPDATLHRWATAGNKSQKVAAWLAEWAARQPPGTIVPADDIIIARLPEITGQHGHPTANNPATARRAIRLLADRHVLHRDRHTGHHHVTASTPPQPPDTRFRETWTDTIREIHATISDTAGITYTSRDGEPVRLTCIGLGILLPDHQRPGKSPYYLETTGTDSDGHPAGDTYHDGEEWPPELHPLIPVLTTTQPYDPDTP